MQNLMLHCGGKAAKYTELKTIPIPPTTQSYQPVPHVQLVDHIRNRTEELIGPVTQEQYGLNKKGNQLFGTFRVNSDTVNSGISVGFRNSYDKSLSVAVVTGANVFVCDNLMINGSSMKIVRRHTKNVWQDATQLIDLAIGAAPIHHRHITEDAQAMAQIAVNEDHGYKILGVLLGHRFLLPQQGSIAIEQWRNPTHEDFGPRNLWSLYNACTEGLKRGSVASKPEQHAALHTRFCQALQHTQDVAVTRAREIAQAEARLRGLPVGAVDTAGDDRFRMLELN